jgi:endonuclease/exonuclease/phosphatase family metal-dependent hydrolase
MRLIRNAFVRIILVLIATVTGSSAYAAGAVTVMTRNMDAGTDFGFFLANLATNPALGVQLTLQEVAKNNFQQRASLLASEIAAARPDLVGLQEATVWTVPTSTGGEAVLNQLQMLLTALEQQNQTYSVVAVNPLTTLSFPLGGGAVASFFDRDVIIVRNGSPISISDEQAHVYQTLLPPLTVGDTSIPVLRGWLSVDAKLGNTTFRFVTTHLESSGGMYGNPQVDQLQAAQAQELAQAFLSSPYPVVVAGDFNSNATHTPPERTQSYNIMVNAGYVDAWSALRHGIPGFTWPLYLEDPLRNHTQGPLERIDFIFSRGVGATSVNRTGLKAPYPSDHAGVVSKFNF